jgi:hypothetical protein
MYNNCPSLASDSRLQDPVLAARAARALLEAALDTAGWPWRRRLRCGSMAYTRLRREGAGERGRPAPPPRPSRESPAERPEPVVARADYDAFIRAARVEARVEASDPRNAATSPEVKPRELHPGAS